MSRREGAWPAVAELELFTQRFAALTLEMGEQLRRTAVSTNVKERLDFSCALLDAEGRLVVNAPHIPVHLGALGLCVRAVTAHLPLGPGDVAVTNHPGFGGSHLPDVTVVTPIFEGPSADHGRRETGAGRLLGYVASRAHHAEIGGTRPGSMPPAATRLLDEGVVLEPTLLVAAGEPRWESMLRRLTAGPHGSRSVEENLADLAAAVAANHRGAETLRRLAEEHGAVEVSRYMADLRRYASDRLAAALARLGTGPWRARTTLDDGTPLAVRIEKRIEKRSRQHGEQNPEVPVEQSGKGRSPRPLLVVDFAGTGGVHAGNLNAPPAVATSAVLYALRLLVAEPLPLNEGLLDSVDLRLPEGLLNPPFGPDPARCPAVVGGNVETSQRVVEVLLSALGLAAASQGTMNNLLFGSDAFGYYETVCGGAGAGPGFDGASGVHTHMTNTRITDPEVLEHRYPVRLERFALRPGSGGAGRWRGGDGVVRELAFLAPMSLSLVTQHRRFGPPGAEGGSPGAPGRQTLHRGPESELLDPVAGRDVEAGDRLVLETPGGGGWGTPE